MNPFAVLLALVQAVPTVVRAMVPPKHRKVQYQDAHHWSDYDLQGERCARHCVYCRQAQSAASRWCPGVPR